MTNIKIFIASSYELSEQRVLIGDYIRRLSYGYSPRGIRVRMLCWEDFYPKSTILYQFEGHTGEETNELAIRINTEYQGFSKTFSHIDTVKSDLLMWTMRHKMPIASHTSKLFKVEEDYIYFCDRPFFQLKMYKELHDTIVLLADEIKKIDIKIKRNAKNGRVKNEELAITLANKRSQKELSIHNAVANWYNKIQLQQSSKSIWAELQTDKVKAGAFSNFQELAKSVNILTEQCEKGVNKQQLNNLSSMLQKWESVAETCLSFCEIQVKEYIKALICIVQICDTYYKKGLRYIKESLDGLFARYPYDPEYIEHSLSQPFHNRAFLYAKNGEWNKAISNYKSALKKRRIVYEKYLDDKDFFEVAQTCVNIGDAYRNDKKFNKALEYAEEALDIYSSKRYENQEVFEMYYYEAYQLKATILMDIDVSNGKTPDIPLSMMEECMKWSNSHLINDYVDRFNGVSGKILQSYKNK